VVQEAKVNLGGFTVALRIMKATPCSVAQGRNNRWPNQVTMRAMYGLTKILFPLERVQAS
jgi:hypothetical protein